jgi:hypothetical protein
MKRYLLKLAVLFVLITVGLVLAGCGESRAPYAGTYNSLEPVAGKNFAELDLKENGKGTWTLAGKTMAEFTWVVNDGKPWFYLKSGGILIATPSEGGKLLSVDMTGDWHPGCPPGSCVIFKRVSEGG